MRDVDTRRTMPNEPDEELAAALAAVEAFLALEQGAPPVEAAPDRPGWRASAKLAAIGLRATRTRPPRWHTIERARRTWSGMTGVVGL